jgi:hypothetical protein
MAPAIGYRAHQSIDRKPPHASRNDVQGVPISGNRAGYVNAQRPMPTRAHAQRAAKSAPGES